MGFWDDLKHDFAHFEKPWDPSPEYCKKVWDHPVGSGVVGSPWNFGAKVTCYAQGKPQVEDTKPKDKEQTPVRQVESLPYSLALYNSGKTACTEKRCYKCFTLPGLTHDGQPAMECKWTDSGVAATRTINDMCPDGYHNVDTSKSLGIKYKWPNNIDPRYSGYGSNYAWLAPGAIASDYDPNTRTSTCVKNSANMPQPAPSSKTPATPGGGQSEKYDPNDPFNRGICPGGASDCGRRVDPGEADKEKEEINEINLASLGYTNIPLISTLGGISGVLWYKKNQYTGYFVAASFAIPPIWVRIKRWQFEQDITLETIDERLYNACVEVYNAINHAVFIPLWEVGEGLKEYEGTLYFAGGCAATALAFYQSRRMGLPLEISAYILVGGIGASAIVGILESNESVWDMLGGLFKF